MEENGNAFIYNNEPEVSLDTVEEVELEPLNEPAPWKQLGKALIPSRLFSRQTKWYSRLWEIVKLPYIVVFSLTIPICESEENEESSADESWSQYLHVIQCILAPQLVTFAAGFGITDLAIDPDDKFHIWEIVLVNIFVKNQQHVFTIKCWKFLYC